MFTSSNQLGVVGEDSLGDKRWAAQLQHYERQITWFVVFFVLIISIYPQSTSAQVTKATTTGGTTTAIMIGELPMLLPKVTIRKVWLTAYTSSPEETDDTPFITASGGQTGDGVAAANFLPFGTKFKVPSIFGDKIFTIEDRMHPRMVGFVDIWVPTKEIAYKIGKSQVAIEILE